MTQPTYADGLEAAAKAVEEFAANHRPHVPPEKRQTFTVAELGRWVRAALTLAVEDIRALKDKAPTP